MAWLFIWLLGYRLLLPVWPDALRWLLLSGLALGYGLWILWSNLLLNHRSGEASLLPRLDWGNQLSMLRGLIIGLLSSFLSSDAPTMLMAWLIALLYTAASIADWLDDYFARKTNHATELSNNPILITNPKYFMAETEMSGNLEQNKQTAQAFYEMMFNDCRPREAVEKYVGVGQAHA